MIGIGNVGRNSFIIAYLSILLALAVKGNVTDDTRFGWGMFAKVFYYTVQVSAVTEDGERVRVPNTAYKKGVRGSA